MLSRPRRCRWRKLSFVMRCFRFSWAKALLKLYESLRRQSKWDCKCRRLQQLHVHLVWHPRRRRERRPGPDGMQKRCAEAANVGKRMLTRIVSRSRWGERKRCTKNEGTQSDDCDPACSARFQKAHGRACFFFFRGMRTCWSRTVQSLSMGRR